MDAVELPRDPLGFRGVGGGEIARMLEEGIGVGQNRRWVVCVTDGRHPGDPSLWPEGAGRRIRFRNYLLNRTSTGWRPSNGVLLKFTLSKKHSAFDRYAVAP
jgi:hypothetical protein